MNRRKFLKRVSLGAGFLPFVPIEALGCFSEINNFVQFDSQAHIENRLNSESLARLIFKAEEVPPANWYDEETKRLNHYYCYDINKGEYIEPDLVENEFIVVKDNQKLVRIPIYKDSYPFPVKSSRLGLHESDKIAKWFIEKEGKETINILDHAVGKKNVFELEKEYSLRPHVEDMLVDDGSVTKVIINSYFSFRYYLHLIAETLIENGKTFQSNPYKIYRSRFVDENFIYFINSDDFGIMPIKKQVFHGGFHEEYGMVALNEACLYKYIIKEHF